MLKAGEQTRARSSRQVTGEEGKKSNSPASAQSSLAKHHQQNITRKDDEKRKPKKLCKETVRSLCNTQRPTQHMLQQNRTPHSMKKTYNQEDVRMNIGPCWTRPRDLVHNSSHPDTFTKFTSKSQKKKLFPHCLPLDQ